MKFIVDTDKYGFMGVFLGLSGCIEQNMNPSLSRLISDGEIKKSALLCFFSQTFDLEDVLFSGGKGKMRNCAAFQLNQKVIAKVALRFRYRKLKLHILRCVFTG